MSKDNDRFWNPWRGIPDMSPRLKITGPPCSRCIYWDPHQEFEGAHGANGGVRCCASNVMHTDFSCFSVHPDAVRRLDSLLESARQAGDRRDSDDLDRIEAEIAALTGENQSVEPMTEKGSTEK